MQKNRGLELQEAAKDLRDDHRCHFVGDDGLGLAVMEPQGLEGVDAEGALVLHAAVARHPALQRGCRDCLLCCTGGRTHNLRAAALGQGGSRENKEGRREREGKELFFSCSWFRKGKSWASAGQPPADSQQGEAGLGRNAKQPFPSHSCKQLSSSLPACHVAPSIREGPDPEQLKVGLRKVGGRRNNGSDP